MLITARVIFWISAGLVAYSYLLYPLLLWLAARMFGNPVRRDLAYVPTVTFLVPAYNEQAVIREKIRNILALEYPPERLTILIGSDKSHDQTCDIVRELQKTEPRIKLWMASRRCGKTGVLNELAPRIDTEVVVFTDANTMHEPGSLKVMVSAFADPAVGAVAGRIDHKVRAGGLREERLYRSFEVRQKESEALLHSVIGAFGGFYAIRARLFRPLPHNAYSNDDVLIPMDIARRGYRVWFEPGAVSTEDASGRLRSEFKRRVRIGAGNFQSLVWLADFLNPLRGWRWFCYVSHKVLRWLSPVLFLSCAVALAVLAVVSAGPVYQLLFGCAMALFLAAAASRLAPLPFTRSLFYFFAMNLALLIGCGTFIGGIRTAAWERSDRG